MKKQGSSGTLLKVGSIVVGLAFIAAGGMKLTGPPQMAADFVRWGYPAWFVYMIGAFEVAGGIGLMLRKFSGLAAAGLLIIMTGAVGTHLRAGEFSQMVPSLVLGVLSLLIVHARRVPGAALFGLVPRRS